MYHLFLSSINIFNVNMARSLWLLQLLLVFLLAKSAGCQSVVSIRPSYPVYWPDSRINITCKTALNVKVEECSWFVNNKRIVNGQFFVKQTECSIVVPAAIAQNGKWKCRVHSSTGSDLPEMTASTYVTVLEISQRECVIIVSSAVAIVLLSIVAVRLAMKYREEKLLNEQRVHYLEPSAPGLVANNQRRNSTPPPTYEKVVDDRVFGRESAQLNVEVDDRYYNNSQLDDDEWTSCVYKTRSAPTLF